MVKSVALGLYKESVYISYLVWLKGYVHHQKFLSSNLLSKYSTSTFLVSGMTQSL